MSREAWIKRLLPNIRNWADPRVHGATSYHLTQLLTGYDCFRAYLHRFGRVESHGGGLTSYHTRPLEVVAGGQGNCQTWKQCLNKMIPQKR